TKAKFFIGKVEYKAERLLMNYANTIEPSGASLAREAAHALCFKRTQFQFEEEIRLLCIERNDAPFRRIPIEPKIHLSGIMIGPMRPEHQDRVDRLKKKLIHVSGGVKVRQSLIHRPWCL